MTKKIMLAFLLLAILVYLADRYSLYLDRQFHYSNQTSGPSVKVNLVVERIYIDGQEFSFDPPIEISDLVTEDSTTQIIEIKQIGEKSFGVSFAYHYSLTNISRIGDNPEFEKRMTLEALYYTRNVGQRWKWHVVRPMSLIK